MGTVYTYLKHLGTLCADIIFPESEIAHKVRTLTKETIDTFTQSERTLPHTWSMWSYKDPLVKEAIWQIKYYENENLVHLLSHTCAQYLETHIPQNTPVLIIPVPLSKKRLAERGFNQADHIAHTIYTHLQKTFPLLMYDNTLVEKTVHTESQTKKNKYDRRINLQGSFTITPHTYPLHTHILLIDDVITTGATTDEITHVLKTAGFSRVYRFTLAH